jgi:hypothetical protein
MNEPVYYRSTCMGCGDIYPARSDDGPEVVTIRGRETGGLFGVCPTCRRKIAGPEGRFVGSGSVTACSYPMNVCPLINRKGECP